MDKRLDAIADKALQSNREQRYSTASEMKTEIDKVAARGSSDTQHIETSRAKAPSDIARSHHRDSAWYQHLLIFFENATTANRSPHQHCSVRLSHSLSCWAMDACSANCASRTKLGH